VSHLIATYGYWAVFALVAAECLGIPLPGETALILASAYAGSTHRLSPWVIFAVAVSAAILGDNAGFWIGATGGYRLARVHGRKVGLDDRKLKLARYLFDRHGGKVVLFGRFIVVLRTWAAFLAGASRMRWLRFLPANAAGGILWAATYTLAADLAGDSLRRVSGTIDLILGAAGILIIVVVSMVIRHETERLSSRAEAAYPGPLD
jgi:membrane protein DedA with SNARE-associated domain